MTAVLRNLLSDASLGWLSAVIYGLQAVFALLLLAIVVWGIALAISPPRPRSVRGAFRGDANGNVRTRLARRVL